MIKRIDILGEVKNSDGKNCHSITVYTENDDKKNITITIIEDEVLLPFLAKIKECK